MASIIGETGFDLVMDASFARAAEPVLRILDRVDLVSLLRTPNWGRGAYQWYFVVQ
jgi:hypothetical protein